MKQIREVPVMSTKKVYVADDGEEFGSESECREYEREQEQQAAEKRVQKIPHFEFAPPFAGEFDDDPTWTWYYIRSEDDLADIKLALYSPDCTANNFELDAFPTWVAATSDGSGYGTFWTVEEVIDCMEDFKKSLEEKCKTTENDMARYPELYEGERTE